MYTRRYFAVFILLIVSHIAAACAPSATRVVIIPTLAELPSETPTSTATSTLTPTLRPTDTPTPNLLETQIIYLNATNAAAQQTLAALLTQKAPTNTPEFTFTPSVTITSTLPPSETPPAVIAMQPQPIYIMSTANLRTCAHRDCERIAQLQPGETVMATGTILGEAIDAVHGSWFRVEYQGRVLYVYSQLVSINAPAPPSEPIFIPPPGESAPISLPPVAGGGGCPSLSATCGQLTCDQAYACLAAGNGRLDRDNDGIPCESVCLGD